MHSRVWSDRDSPPGAATQAPPWSPLVAILVGYAIAGVFVAVRFRHQINPDGTSYLDISQQYLDGNFRAAVNGYWGPLYSWLLMPFIGLGMDPLLAAKVLGLLVGAAGLTVLYRLLSAFTTAGVTVLLSVAMAGVVLGWVAQVITPDLIVLSVSLGYLWVLSSASAWIGTRRATCAGVLGGVGYLAKAYFLPFFLLHFTVLYGVRMLRGATRRAALLKEYLIGVGVFAAISLPWIAALSVKYDQLTFGTAGSVIRARGESPAPGLLDGGLRRPPGGAISNWADPSLRGASNSPGHLLGTDRGVGALRDRLQTTTSKIFGSFDAFLGFSPWLLLLVAGAALAIARPHRDLGLMVGYCGCYLAGYLLTIVEPRYLWPAMVILVVGSAHLLAVALPRVHRWALIPTTALLAGSIMWANAEPVRADPQPYDNLALTATEIARIPSFSCRSIAAYTEWQLGLYVAFQLDCPFYGILRTGIAPAQASAELTAARIDFVLVFGPVPYTNLPTGYELATPEPIRGITVLHRLPGFR